MNRGGPGTLRKPVDQRNDMKLHTALTEAQHDIVVSRAQAMQIPVSEYIRRLILKDIGQ